MLSQTVGYAATALGCIATMGGKPTLVKEVAENCDIPPAYLSKIIHALARKGLVQTQRGVGGGVCLARPPQQISLYELCVSLDDPIIARRCLLGAADCSDDFGCPAHRFWGAHRDKLIEFLRQTTVADVAAFEIRRLWRRQHPRAENS